MYKFIGNHYPNITYTDQKISGNEGKRVDKCGSAVTRFFLDKMLKMVKTMRQGLKKLLFTV